MGVTTSADEAKYRASVLLKEISLESIDEIVRELETSINPEVWGGNDWKEEYVKGVEKDIKKLRKLQTRLKQIQRKY